MRPPRLTASMREALAVLANPYSVLHVKNNDSRTFRRLEAHGLIQPSIDGTWALTEAGRQLAKELRKGR